jgi:uncharacterized protein (TIGR02391 family)
MSPQLIASRQTRVFWENSSRGIAMNKWYLEVRKLLREIHKKALDAQAAWRTDDKSSAETIKGYLKDDYRRLQTLWNEYVEGNVPSSLGRHIAWGMANDYEDILYQDLPALEETLDSYLDDATEEKGEDGFEHLLHPAVVESSLELFKSGHYRDAVLNSIVAIFDLMRSRTGIDADGSALVNRAFSLTDPYLVLSEIDTDSGQNDQKGFIQLFSGSYQGIRNPKAHSLNHDLTDTKVAQYLVHASLLARRVTEAQQVKTDARQEPAKRKPIRS